MSDYNVIVLGSTGVGKTVLLASMFNKLSVQRNDIGFFLSTPENQRKLLVQKYAEVKSRTWPSGTRKSEVSEWQFSCRVQTENIQKHTAAGFSYWDYAGERITDIVDSDDEKMNRLIQDADVLIGILDGHKIYAQMTGIPHPLGSSIDTDLDFILPTIMDSTKPTHFIITKWDLIEGEFTFRQVRDFLLSYENFSALVEGRMKQNIPMRLIPVSAVGKGFAKLKPDGSMQLMKGVSPHPFQVEMPFACILPDGLQGRLREVIERKREIENISVNIPPQYSFWDSIGRLIGGLSREFKSILPKQYKFTDPVLYKLIDFLEKGALEKDKFAAQKLEQLRADKEVSLRSVGDEESALYHVISSCMYLMTKLKNDFPESDLSRIV